MKRILALIFILAPSFCNYGLSQTRNSIFNKVDDLFKQVNNQSTPGASIAIVKNGKIIYKKGYGLGNLEYKQPLTSSSIFHIASESKQFTAFCIVLLAKEGKLHLDDDIRKYLPYVPQFRNAITIRSLIHHTSGLRDQYQLLQLVGQRLEDVMEQTDILKLVERQKDLNFVPGSRHIYCNTGYTLLAEIIKKVSGKSLREYADEKIFKPLGMTHTHFHDDNREIVAGRTYSYDSFNEGIYVNSSLNYATVGATGLFTNVEDEAKWLINYETGQVGGKATIDQMYQLGQLNNGTKLEYAFGLVIDTFNGYRRIGHGGADAGYRTYTVHFPEEKLGIIVFSNFAQFDPRDIATKIANLFLPVNSSGITNASTNGNYKADIRIYSTYVGMYYSDEGILEVGLDNDKLLVRLGGQPISLIPLSDSSFLWKGYAIITFEKDAAKSNAQFKLKSWQEEQDKIYTRFVKPILSEAARSSYVGSYDSEELDTRYYIVSENNQLILRHRKYSDGTLEAITNDQFSTSKWWMDNIIFTRDRNGSIIGFEVNSGGVLHLNFKKIN